MGIARLLAGAGRTLGWLFPYLGFRAAFDVAAIGLAHVNEEGRLLRVNAQFSRMLGYAAADLRGKTLYDITDIAGRTADLNAIRSGERRLVHHAGYLVPVLLTFSRMHSAKAGPHFFVCVCQDLTASRRASEDKLRFAQSAAGAGMYGMDLASGRMDWTEENYSLFGIENGTPMTRDIWFSTILPDDQPRVRSARELAISSGVDIDIEYRVRRGDGMIRWIHAEARLLRDATGIPVRLVGLNCDITRHKLAELRMRRMADAMPQIVWTSQPNLQVEYYNRRWYEYTGIEPGSGDNSWEAVIHPSDMQSCLEMRETTFREGSPSDLHCRLRRADGTYRWHLVRSVPLRDDAGEVTEWVGTSTDIDDYKRLSDELVERVSARTSQLKCSLAEKEVLLKEVQHRVKNNLQIICSLVAMQIDCAVDRGVVAPLIEAQGRICAMALVHQQLHESNNLLALNLAAYVEPLAEQIFEAYGVSRSRIRLHCSIEPLLLTVVQAMPCGFILNELLSNALKHAFRSSLEGEITITFGQSPESGHLFLCVADNGPGLPDGFKATETPSLGFQIVTAMARQLNAELQVCGRDGTSVRLDWATAE